VKSSDERVSRVTVSGSVVGFLLEFDPVQFLDVFSSSHSSSVAGQFLTFHVDRYLDLNVDRYLDFQKKTELI